MIANSDMQLWQDTVKGINETGKADLTRDEWSALTTLNSSLSSGNFQSDESRSSLSLLRNNLSRHENNPALQMHLQKFIDLCDKYFKAKVAPASPPVIQQVTVSNNTPKDSRKKSSLTKPVLIIAAILLTGYFLLKSNSGGLPDGQYESVYKVGILDKVIIDGNNFTIVYNTGQRLNGKYKYAKGVITFPEGKSSDYSYGADCTFSNDTLYFGLLPFVRKRSGSAVKQNTGDNNVNNVQMQQTNSPQTAAVTAVADNAQPQASPITLDKTELELIVGEEQPLKAATTPAGQSVTWTSGDESKATVEGSYGEAKVIGKTAGMVNINATYSGKTVSCTVTIHDIFSQTGVTIDGITWATRNVGAPSTFAAKASDAGMLYQWNRRIGWSSTDPMVNSNNGTEWDNSVPTGTTWEAANDPSPAGWRVPTYEELNKLINNASSVQIIVDGKGGVKIGSGNNAIFLPNPKGRNNGYLSEYGTTYWSSTEYGRDGAYGQQSTYSRNNAFNIRCVKK